MPRPWPSSKASKTALRIVVPGIERPDFFSSFFRGCGFGHFLVNFSAVDREERILRVEHNVVSDSVRIPVLMGREGRGVGRLPVVGRNATEI